ncbi:MAG: GNAT family N-acetyltransferase [Gammaproteobacteria bacterium]|nr:GNAT family N-acetyltransferase [Gammaproteobacteria bacterium]
MSEQACRIQPMQAADIEQVIQLDKNLGKDSRPDFFHRRLEMMQSAGDRYLCFTSVYDASLCGFLFARILTGEFGAQRPVAVLDAIGVQPGNWGQGVGMQLMERVKQEAAMRGCGEIRTQVDWHQQELLAYFANAGFTLGSRHVLKRDTSALVLPDREDELDDPESDQYELRPVRTLAESDIDAILRIDRHITKEDRSVYLREKVDEVVSHSGMRVSMVAEQEGMVTGFIMARLDYGSFGRASSTAVIDTLGVGPEYKSSGVGSALMAQLLDNLASVRVEDVRTEVEWDSFELNRFLSDCAFKPSQHLALSCVI